MKVLYGDSKKRLYLEVERILLVQNQAKNTGLMLGIFYCGFSLKPHR